MITRRTALAATLISPLARPALALGAGKVLIGCTAAVDYAGAFAAQEQGFFRRRGLDTEIQLIALNSTIPAALQSDSIQLGGPTPSVMLSAVDGGIELVALSACAEITRDSTTFGVVARTGVDITDARGFAGKRVGVPGLNAFLHVIFRKWLMDNHEDSRRVNFVEIGFPQMADVLRSGTVDAVVTGEPVMSRITGSNVGRLVSTMTPDLREPLPTTFWATTRDWAARNEEAARNLRAGIADGVAWVNANPDGARECIAKYTKLPIDIVRTVPLARLRTDVTDRDITAWLEIMTAQDMLTTRIDPAQLRFA